MPSKVANASEDFVGQVGKGLLRIGHAAARGYRVGRALASLTSMSRITREEVERVATLARLSLSGDEVSRMTSQLDAILEYVELLRAVDTKGVEPTSHAVPIRTPLREDRAAPSLPPELASANAPEREGSAFVVPPVLEGEEH